MATTLSWINSENAAWGNSLLFACGTTKSDWTDNNNGSTLAGKRFQKGTASIAIITAEPQVELFGTKYELSQLKQYATTATFDMVKSNTDKHTHTV